jgi:hypothetical protein
LTSIVMKSNFTFLSIPTCNLFKNDCNSYNELDARCDILEIKISYDRNSKLCEKKFSSYQAIFDGRNEIIWIVVGKSCIHFFGSCSPVSKANS